MSYTYVSRSPRVMLAEIRQQTYRRFRMASIGIAGLEQTGRKTLAVRFNNMNKGPFEGEFESFYQYTARIDLDTRRTRGTGDLCIRSYIMPTPMDLPEQNPPRFMRELRNLSAIILLSDVTDRETLTDLMQGFRNILHSRRFTHFLVVGNKMDLNRNNFPHHFTSQAGLQMIQNNFMLLNYIECSAKQNINVDLILEEIISRIIAQDP